MSLKSSFDKYKCDKGSLKHRYDRVYEPALSILRNKPFRMLEIGVFKGSSTQAFVNYCPLVEIVALDLYERVDIDKVDILQHPRVTGYRWNSFESPDDKLHSILNPGFDIIIDDGLHTHEAQRLTFNNFIQYLNKGGSYFIEDVWPYDLMTDKQKQHYWLKKYEPAFSEQEYKKLLNVINQYEVKYHDLRKGYDPDTFIIEVKK